MRTGFLGTFVISWSQSELDGQLGAPLSSITVGATWRWYGDAVCVDGPREVLVLEGAAEAVALHERAARGVRRIVGAHMKPGLAYEDPEARDRLFDGSFDVTCGHKRYTVTLIEPEGGGAPLCMFLGEVPPANRDLWVVSYQTGALSRDAGAVAGAGVICFTPGTMIATPDGARPVEDLREGDFIETKDNGAQELRWTGSRRISGARLYALPKMRPIRIRAGALGVGEPDEELLVSPQHKMLVRGAQARALFNEDEVLVAAEDLVNDHSIMVDNTVRGVVYHHLMLDAHQIVFANGVETESFHPGGHAMEMIEDDQRRRLLAAFPEIAAYPDAYGTTARRVLGGAEAAILRHDASLPLRRH